MVIWRNFLLFINVEEKDKNQQQQKNNLVQYEGDCNMIVMAQCNVI